MCHQKERISLSNNDLAYLSARIASSFILHCRRAYLNYNLELLILLHGVPDLGSTLNDIYPSDIYYLLMRFAMNLWDLVIGFMLIILLQCCSTLQSHAYEMFCFYFMCSGEISFPIQYNVQKGTESGDVGNTEA